MNSETPRTDTVVRSHCEDGPFITDHHIALADFARTLECENQQLREAVMVCAAALQGIDEMNDNYFSREELVCDRDREIYDMLHKALNLPSVQAALKNKGQ